MTYLLWLTLGVALSFSIVIFFGAPYVPTLKTQRRQALKMLGLKKNQLLVELGAGDGIMLVEAGRLGIKATGYELNPVLVLIGKVRLRQYKDVNIKWSNFWKADISEADGVYVFLITRFMPKLERKLQSEGKPGLRIVSYTFALPNMEPKKSMLGLFLYELPASRQKKSK